MTERRRHYPYGVRDGVDCRGAGCEFCNDPPSPPAMTDYQRLLALHRLANDQYSCYGDISGVSHDYNDKAFYEAAHVAVPKLVRENETLSNWLSEVVYERDVTRQRGSLLVERTKEWKACSEELDRLRAENESLKKELAKVLEELDRYCGECGGFDAHYRGCTNTEDE